MRDYSYNVILYKNTPVEESSPARFDDLLNALEAMNDSTQKYVFTNVTPFPASLDVDVRLALTGSSETNKDNYAYAVVTYPVTTGKRVLYFFVRQTRWKGNGDLQLSLHMDVIHTLLTDNDLSNVLTAKTMIFREHENRWAYAIQQPGEEESYDFTLIPKVDSVNEGLGSPDLRLIDDNIIYDYRFSGDAIKESWQAVFYASRDSEGNRSGAAIGINQTNEDYVRFYVSGDKPYSFLAGNANGLKTESTLVDKAIIYPYFPFASITQVTHSGDLCYEAKFGQLDFVDELKSEVSSSNMVKQSYSSLFAYGGGKEDVNPIANVDMFEQETQTGTIAIQNVSSAKRRFIDSKLFKSDYYRHCFVYGSSIFSPEYERFEISNKDEHSYEIYFLTDVAPVCTFAFKFKPIGSFKYRGSSAFDEILDVAQNSERTLMTDSYLNYLKNGYNYDVAKQVGSIVSTGATGVGAIIGATAVAGPAGTIAAGVGALVSIATTTINSQISLDAKQASLKASAIKSSNATSFGVFQKSKVDKLHEVRFDLEPNLKKMLDDLFYYYGYRRNYQGVPNVTSRYWFNFVQCSPKYKADFARSWSYLLDELTKKFEYGITYFHRHARVTGQGIEYGYDINQVLENWEKDIIHIP